MDIIDQIQHDWQLSSSEKLEYPEVILISAVGRNSKTGEHNVIGKDNQLPWDFREFKRDMNRFKELTTGHFVLMGRKTFESMGSRALPKRTNLVVSTRKEWPEDKPISVHESIESAIQWFGKTGFRKKLFIIGGQTIYEQCMPYATHIFLTHIDKDVEGDVFFPEIKFAPKELITWGKRDYWKIADEEKDYTEGVKFVTYVREQHQACIMHIKR